MHLVVFNCLLLTSVAVASPYGRHKRDLPDFKNLITSAFFGRSQINIQPSEPSPVLQEEVGYKLFRLPGYEDVMIKVTPKKPVVEEFVYPPAVEKVNLNAFGTVVGTKSKDDTVVAVQGVDNLLSTGILYGGHDNVMKENIVPMFPSINSANYVVEEKIRAAPVIETRPALTKVIESRPLFQEMAQSRPSFTEVVENRPAYTEVIESRPLFQEMTQSRPSFTEVVENRPAFTEVIESRPLFQEMTQSRPSFTEVVENRPAFTEVIESRPLFQEMTQSRPSFTEVVENRPAFTEVIESGPLFQEMTQSRPSFTEVVENRPAFTEVIESRPLFQEMTQSRPSFTEVVENRPAFTEVIESRPLFQEMTQSRPSFTEVVENRPAFTEVIESRPLFQEMTQSRPSFTEVVENRPVFTEVIESRPLFQEMTQSRPSFTEVVENRPAFTEVIESRPLFQEMAQSRPSFTEVVENRPAFTEVIESRPLFQEMTQSRPSFTEVVENRPAFTEVIESRPLFQEMAQSRPSFTEVVENRPAFTEVIESRPLFQEMTQSRPSFTEIIETRPRPVVSEVIETRPRFTELINSRPVLTEVVRPVEERVEIKVPFEPTYSYKQMMNNEPVMTYTTHTNPGVEVLETIKTKTELPMCIKKRVDEAIVLGADPSRFAPVQETIQYQNPPVFDFSYPRVGANFYEQNSFRGEVLTEEFDTVSGFGLEPQKFRPSFQDRPVRYNLRPTKTKAINPRPIPLHSHKSLHFTEDITATKDNVKGTSQTKKMQAFTNLGKKVNIANTLGPIPPRYITHVNNKGEIAVSKDKMKEMKAFPIVGSKDNVSNAKIPNNVYGLQVNPNTGKTLKENSVLRTNVKTNTNRSAMAPTVVAKEDNAQVKNVVYTNKVTAKPQTITRPVVVPSVNAPKISSLKEYIQTSPINKQIVAKEAKSYTYQQKNSDGSSLNVNGSEHGVSVNVKDNNRGRGDIPGQK